MNNMKLNDPFIITIFGASGDLAKIKIFPALYAMAEAKVLPKKFHIIGYARTQKSRQQFQKEFRQSVRNHHKGRVDTKVLNKLLEKVDYFTGDYAAIEDYNRFSETLDKLDGGKFLRLFYFSVPPIAFRPIIKGLGESHMKKRKKKTRLIIEKPFGEDAHSAEQLFHFVARYFEDDNVYLLDHYLGKPAVQSILHLRHSNRLLNAMLKGREVANIQITAFETVGVEDRVGYFERVGMLKDMIQSHLLQILSLVMMSIPVTERAVSVQKEKENILSAFNFLKSPDNVVLGQYESYKKIEGVPRSSRTDTFAALRLFVDRESWYGVPIYIRTGKMLHEKHTYITVELKKFAFQSEEDDPNRVIIELQPNERISIKLINKHMGGQLVQDVVTSDSIACDDACLPEHSMLFIDVVNGNKTYFLTFPEIIAAWKVVDSITDVIKKKKVKLNKYKDRSDGPTAQNKLTALDGFKWYHL